jgi:single-stranded DNA-specific DHH superfamily exonuclease
MDIKKAINWIQNAKKICLIFHIDTDGICSAFITGKAIELLRKELPFVYAYSTASLGKKTYEKLIREEFDLVIFVDLGVDRKPKYLRLLSDKVKVIAFDHHLLKEDLTGENILHFSTHSETEKYYPCSFFVYNIFSEIMNIKKYDWVAAVGLIGDSGADLYKEFMLEVLKKYGIKEEEKFIDTKLGFIDKLLGSARVYNGKKGALKALKVLLECETIEDFYEKNAVLERWYEKVEEYLVKKLNEFKEDHEEFDDTLYYHMEKPEYNVGSPISSKLGYEHPHKTIILVINLDSLRAKIHLRRNDGKINVSDLVEKAVKLLEDSEGGGHPQSAGGNILVKDVPQFKENVKKLLS